MVQLVHSGSTDPTDNLALDEILFQKLERGGTNETLRFWECSQPAVVVGASGHIGQQVHEKACVEDGVPILRRTSGGGAVVIGPGCLNYSLLLSLAERPELYGVANSYQRILTRIAEALSVPRLAIRGISDLAIDDRKISGNSQRRGRRALLHHGTILYDFNVLLMERYLKSVRRQPAYRSGRSHQDFVTNALLPRAAIEQAITLGVRRLNHLRDNRCRD
jgi:lipoate-protein ligase A